MATPRVSPENWERARGLAQIKLGAKTPDLRDAAFERWVDILCHDLDDWDDDNDFRVADEIQPFESGKKERGSYYLKAWPDGVEIEIDPDHQERAHRPDVSYEVVERLERSVEHEMPYAPIDSYGFDQLLGSYLDLYERWYSYERAYLVLPETDNRGNPVKHEV